MNCLISPAELAYLGGLLGEEPSAISPLAELAANQTGVAVDRARLAASGLLQGDRLSPAGVEAVGTLARARAYASIAVIGSGSIDQVVFLDGAHRVSLADAGDLLRLESPAVPTPDLLAVAFGEGTGDVIELDATFSLPEACVLFALVDLLRRRLLQAVLDDTTDSLDPGAPIPVAGLQAWVTRPAASLQWLLPLLRDATEVGSGTIDVDSALASLTEAGQLTVNPGGVLPGAAASVLAGAFLILDLAGRVSAGTLVDGQIATVEMRVAQAQGRQALLWEVDGAGRVRVQCFDPGTLAATLAPLFVSVDALKAP